MRLRTIFYDMDGVLSDSLSPHIEYCDNRNNHHGLKIPKPKTLEEMRKVVGMPMNKFLENYGFPNELIPEIDKHYRENFGNMYEIPLFEGSIKMLEKIQKAGIQQVIATSNFEENSRKQLGTAQRFISDIYAKDTRRGKAGNILHHMALMKLKQNECVLVGDTDSDFAAAEKAKIPFIGVEWGWMITPERGIEDDFVTCYDFNDLTEYLMFLNRKTL